jgi:CheY-like chemotaxis protein
MEDKPIIEWTGLIRVRGCCIFADVGTRQRLIEIRAHHCLECVRALRAVSPPLQLVERTEPSRAGGERVKDSTIMVVDDDRSIREAISDTLADLGCKVVQAADGAEGLAYLRSSGQLPRLVFLDLTMAGMDGYQLRAEMARDPRLARIPIVVVTANHEAANRLGGTPVLKKPLQLQSMLGAIEAYGIDAAS